ncbi:MAG: phosphatidylglycerophosphate synthase [Planctomycetota bacterium]|nr:phosphatidylglycerophosphate synthase [Planctomycetota bacterium]
MSGSSRTLVIDARPRGPRGPLAGERVLGKPVLAHLVDLARECGDGPVAVHARVDEHGPFRDLVSDAVAKAVVFATGPPPEHAAILRTDRLYDAGRLRKALRAGRDPEVAVVWRLDRPSALASADEELVRRRTYQPLGRFWALAPAKALARLLQPTIVRPNAVTLAAAVTMLAAAGVVAFAAANGIGRAVVATALALGLVLDTADGHLARLQGTASEFGRWLDALLDELVDMALHAAIAWAAFRATGNPAWLMLASVYAMGKYLFVVAQQAPETPGVGNATTGIPTRPSLATSAVRLIGHADIRWHVWILLAAMGRLDAALIAYAAYFPARTLALAVRKAVRHG